MLLAVLERRSQLLTYKKRREREVAGDVRATEDPSFWSCSAERGDRVAREGIPRVAACRPNEKRADQRGPSKTSGAEVRPELDSDSPAPSAVLPVKLPCSTTE